MRWRERFLFFLIWWLLYFQVTAWMNAWMTTVAEAADGDAEASAA